MTTDTEPTEQAPLRWWWYLLLVVAIFISLHIRLASVGEPGDDAYITLRHVKNIVAGKGYVYNDGIPMLGTSTALYPLLLSLICVVTGLDPIQGGVPLYVVSEIVSLALLAYVATKLLRHQLLGVLVCLAYSLSRYAANAAMIHMEAPLFTALLLIPSAAVLWEDSRRSRTIASLGAGFALLCRPEGVLMLCALGAYYLIKDRRFPVRESVLMLVPVVPWIAFATWYFGSPIPQSVKAKAVGYLTNPNQAVTEMGFHLSQLFTGTDSASLSSSPVMLNISIFLFLVGAMTLIRRQLESMVPVGFTVLFVLFYVIGNPFIFIWYMPPLEPGYLLCIAAGLSLTTATIASTLGRPACGTCVASAIAAAAVLVMLNRYNFYGPLGITALDRDRPWLTYRHSGRPPVAGLRYAREGYYKLAAEDLAPFVSPKTTVLAPEFGSFGYYSDTSIISSVGHINPEAMPFLPPIPEETALPDANHSVPKKMVYELKPDYVLSLECFIRKSLLPDPRFNAEYETWKFYPGANTFGSKGMYLFKRRAVPQDAPVPTQG